MRTKRFLSIVLTLAMLLGLFPGMNLTAYAEGNTTTITPSSTSGTMTITLKIKAVQTITVSDVTATYGDTDKSVSASVTTPSTGGGAISYAVKTGSEDYIGVDASTGALTIKKVPADGKAYVIVTAAGTDDYAETTKEVTVTISKAEAIVTAKDQSIMVGSTVPDLSAPVLNTHYSVTGLIGTDTLTTAPTLVYQKNGREVTPDNTTKGTYDIVASGASAGDNYAINYTKGTLTISEKQPATVTKAPEAKTLTYNGSAQKLVSAGKAEGGEMQYALGDDEETAPTEGFSTSIPEGTEADTYYVWYKVVGDENHNDAAAKCVKAAIAHKITEVAEVPATCEETGVERHWIDETGTLYKDAEGKEVTTEEELTIPATGHSWDAGKITKKATLQAEGEKTFTCTVCGETRTESIPKLKVKPVLVAKGIAKGKKAVNISWNKLKDADRYEIYISKCNYNGKKFKMKKVKTLNGKTFKWTKKGLKKNTAYKFYVKALKKSGKKYKLVAKSKTAHFFTSNARGKYTNPKSLKLKKSKITLKKGKTATIKGTVTKVKKNKKLATGHAAKLRFTSNNPSVATVNAKCKVTAKSKGTATIYVQTINGIWKTCKVTVK